MVNQGSFYVGRSTADDSSAAFLQDFTIDASGNSTINNNTTFTGNVTIHNTSNAPYIDFVESGATTDSKARITMDQVDTDNASLLFATEGGGTLTTRMTINKDGVIGMGSTGIYAGTNARLNLDGKGIALKNDKDGSDNNWTYLQNTGTSGDSDLFIMTASASYNFGGTGSLELNSRNTGTGTTDLNSLSFKKSHPSVADTYYTLGEIKGYTAGGYAGGLSFYYGKHTGGGNYASTFGMRLTDDGNFYVGSGAGIATCRFTARGSTDDSTSHALEAANSSGGTLMSVRCDGDVEIGANPRTGKFQVATNSADYIASLVTLRTTGSDCYGYEVKYENATPNGTGNHFAFFHDSTGEKCSFPSNGGIRNFQTNDINLSDRRFKEDIVDAPNSLDIISQLKVRNYKLKDRSDERVNTGLIAQEVEEVCKELVNNDGLQAKNSDESNDMKGIYNADLMFMMLKSIQELKAEVDELKNKCNCK
tara:strand:- start:77 stop:1510 length:1434 start_codon:yes stop_codon:yes gene_type:complete